MRQAVKSSSGARPISKATVGCAMSDQQANESSADQSSVALTQTAMLWAPDGSASLALDNPTRIKRAKRDALRGDARRTAEYLATRGKTPVEVLHDIAGMTWLKAVHILARELRVSPERAFELWKECVALLLPYTAARFDVIELGSNAAGGLALGHFLAARAMGDMLAADRGTGGTGLSRLSPSLDGQQAIDLASVNPSQPDPSRLGLPPKGQD
jgi:hypothetical protein